MNRPLNADPELPIEPQLAALLDVLRPVPPRNAQAAMRGHATFMAQAAALKPEARAARAVVLAGWLSNARRRSFAPAVRSIFAVALVMGMAIFGSATVVSAAQGSLPNEPLYPVKVWSEDVRLSLASNSNTKLDLLVMFANRRKAELDALAVRHVQPSPAFYERFGRQVDAALESAGAGTAIDPQARATLEALREQTRPVVPSATPAPSRPTPTPIPSQTPQPPTEMPAPAAAPTSRADDPIAPSTTPLPATSPAPANAPTPTPAKRDELRATLAALPRADARATVAALSTTLHATAEQHSHDVRETVEAVPVPALPPQPDFEATRAAAIDAMRATRQALPTAFPRPDQPDLAATPSPPQPQPEQPTPDAQATMAEHPTPLPPETPPVPDFQATRQAIEGAIRATREALPPRPERPRRP